MSVNRKDINKERRSFGSDSGSLPHKKKRTGHENVYIYKVIETGESLKILSKQTCLELVETLFSTNPGSGCVYDNQWYITTDQGWGGPTTHQGWNDEEGTLGVAKCRLEGMCLATYEGVRIKIDLDDDTTPPRTLVLKSNEEFSPLKDDFSSFPCLISKPAKLSSTSPPLVLTYEILQTKNRNVSIQLLTTQTFYDLVDTVCRETCVGLNEGVLDHLWEVTDNSSATYKGPFDQHIKKREKNAKDSFLGSSVGGQVVGERLVITYDRSVIISLILKSVKALPEDTEESSFPRLAPYAPFRPNPDALCPIDSLYPALSKFLFRRKSQSRLEINLFQPGKKRVQAFIVNKHNNVLHKLHLPEKFKYGVGEMLFALNDSIQKDIPKDGLEGYGVSIFPPGNAQSHTYMRYKVNQLEEDRTVIRGYQTKQQLRFYGHKFALTFPKCSAAAGYNQDLRPSKSHERGYIVYKNGVLMVCQGSSFPVEGGGRPGAWNGFGKHSPMNEEDVVGEVKVVVRSLYDLFCAAEGLW